MSAQPPLLSERRIVNYNRLQSDVMAMVYVLCVQKVSGPLGLQTIRACNRMIDIAKRLYGREHGMPRFRLLIEDEPFTLADLAILIARLTAAGNTFEARYNHYKEENLHRRAAAAAPALDADGIPSKHL